MKFILGMALVFSLAFSQDIKFAKDYASAISEAQKSDKAVILIYSMEDCSACEYLKDITLDDENVKNYINEKFVVVDRNAKNKAEHIKGFPVFGTPTLYFLNKKGEQIAQPMVGATTPKIFLQKLKQIR